jgi:GNAT acetyltransferase-like protein
LEDFIFHEGSPPGDYNPDFDFTLFNQPDHLFIQSAENWHSFSVLNKKYKTVEGIFFVHICEDVARSPLRSPWGSFEISPSIPNVTLYEFLEFVESRLRAKGVKKITIKEPPSSFQPDRAALLHTFLFNLGYHISNAEIGAVIHTSSNSFESYPDSWERRKLKQSYEAGLQFKQLKLSQLSDVYLFILTCRKHRGYSLSMSLAELKHTVERFRNDYVLFGIFKNETLAAASISIQVKKKILYNFYSAHHSDFDEFSPVVMLVEGMYQHCAKKQIELLDLGTSAADGKPNFNLLDFKLRLGAKPSTKLTFEKDFS